MKLPDGILCCDVCGEEIEPVAGRRVTEFTVDDVEDTLHSHDGECLDRVKAVLALGTVDALPAMSPLRLFLEGDEDPFRALRERHAARVRH